MSAETELTTAGAPQVTGRYSTNWCGYLITGATGAFQSVSAQWQVPQPLAGPSNDYATLATIWVGLNGVNKQSVCLTQAGCDVNAYESPGYPVETEFDSWYELELSGQTGETKLGSGYPVAALDNLSCTITHVGGLEFTIELRNLTQNWNYQQNHSYPAGSPQPLMNSAEIIVEAPVWVEDYIGKLTNFGTVTFQNVSINGQPLTSFANQATALTMLNDTRQQPTGTNVLATPGAFGNTFTVTWNNFGTKRKYSPQQL